MVLGDGRAAVAGSADASERHHGRDAVQAVDDREVALLAGSPRGKLGRSWPCLSEPGRLGTIG